MFRNDNWEFTITILNVITVKRSKKYEYTTYEYYKNIVMTINFVYARVLSEH